jgi:hypothetical protein
MMELSFARPPYGKRERRPSKPALGSPKFLQER